VSADVGRTGARVVDAVYREIVRARCRHLLLVDDDEAFRTALLALVRPYCANPAVAGDARAALAAAHAGAVDSVVLDLIMPDVDGFTFLRLLRDDPATAAIPVLTCSSKALISSELRLLSGLRSPFLSKTELDRETLVRGLVEAWTLSRASRDRT